MPTHIYKPIPTSLKIRLMPSRPMPHILWSFFLTYDSVVSIVELKKSKILSH